METKKPTDIKGSALSRSEMKKIKAGAGGPTCTLDCMSLGIIYQCYDTNCYFAGGGLHCGGSFYYCTIAT